MKSSRLSFERSKRPISRIVALNMCGSTWLNYFRIEIKLFLEACTQKQLKLFLGEGFTLFQLNIHDDELHSEHVDEN